MDTILFDLDGTLLPMDQDHFMKVYFAELVKKCASFGFKDKDRVVAAVWKGTAAMVQNDGTRPNAEVFWQLFGEALGSEALALKSELELFYVNEFNAAKAATRPNPHAKALLEKLNASGVTMVLATNPLFPLCAVHTRLAWLGLSPDLFAHITSYETPRYCKPNLAYYRETLEAVGKTPKDCLMVGNDVAEDGCVAQLGMRFFLVTDSLLNPGQLDISQFEYGTFTEAGAHINQLFAWPHTAKDTTFLPIAFL